MSSRAEAREWAIMTFELVDSMNEGKTYYFGFADWFAFKEVGSRWLCMVHVRGKGIRIEFE